MEFFAYGITIGLLLLLFGGKGKVKLSLTDLQARCAAGDQSACALLSSMSGGGGGTSATGSGCRCGGLTTKPVDQTNIPGSGAPGAYSTSSPIARTFSPGPQIAQGGQPNVDRGPFSMLGV